MSEKPEGEPQREEALVDPIPAEDPEPRYE
jgi:hypothetical protein